MPHIAERITATILTNNKSCYQNVKFAIHMATKTTNKLNNDQKKELAYMLYTKEGVTVHKVLAKRVDATPKTISKWIVEGKWEKRRQNMLLTREEQMQNLLIELEELNAYIKTKPEGKRFADSKEGDIRRKLIKDIKDLETKASVSEIIGTCKRIVQWLAPIDFEKSKQVADIFNSFIKDNLK